MNKLKEICAAKRREVAARKGNLTINDLDRAALSATPPRGFRDALMRASQTGFGLIAEVKKASPSKGLIRADFRPHEHAIDYEKGGATCLSVLTETTYFQGHDDHLLEARKSCALPVLRKDFIIDPWQVAEARALNSDAILIIVAALDDGTMKEVETAAIERNMDVLVEIHDEGELERALTLQSQLFGINNRDLKTFKTDLATTERLAPLAPEECLVVGESGIESHDDCQRLSRSGVRCFLVGESLMRQTDVRKATSSLLTG